MATRYGQNDSWARAAGNLGEALFPNARTVAAGRIAGQQLSELAARTQKARAEAAGTEDQNAALADAVLEHAGFNPMQRAVIRAGRGNAQQLAESYQTMDQVDADRSAGDAFATGDMTGTGAARLRGGREPLKTNEIDNGYQINPYATGGSMTPTTATLADVIATEALARQRDASAGYDRERANHPERFRGTGGAGGKAADISPSESKALDDLIGNFLPSIRGEPVDGKPTTIPAEIDPMLRNQVLSRAADLYRETGNAQTAVDQAFHELVQQTQAGAPAVAAQDNWDFWGLGTPDVEAAPAKPYKFGPHQAAPQPAAVARGRTPDQVKADYQAGRISREAAKAELQQMGFN